MSDYVVVGAGAAGCVLASRLTESPRTTVTLLEAGGSDRKLHVALPAAFSKLFKTDADWAYSTEPEAKLDDRRLFWPRGRMLGGSSSMNAMIYIRGTPSDYDAWGASGCAGWSWDDVLPFFRRSEKNQRGSSELHGGDGPFQVADLRCVNEVSDAFVAASVACGYLRNDDFNGPRQEGFGRYQVNQRKGRRFSAADAFLTPARKRPNLRVETDAHATRLLFDGARCIGVEYMRQGRKERALAAREVLLTAGAINSPQLLLLSGVGPQADLRALGIEVIADSPGVGKNLQDHLIAVMTYACEKPVTLDVAETVANLGRFLAFGEGPLTSNVAEVGGFLKTRRDLAEPDIQALFAPAWFVDHGFTKPEGCGFSLGATLLRPESRGQITLRSTDPRAAPKIEARYLTTDRDRQTLVDGIKALRAIVAAAPMAPYRGRERTPGDAVRSDDDVARYLKGAVETLYHPVGTCKMGTDRLAVVDPALRVRGVGGLRVIDASVMPTIPGGNTQAPTLMIAERAVPLLAG
jgi:choline dehydrogenase